MTLTFDLFELTMVEDMEPVQVVHIGGHVLGVGVTGQHKSRASAGIDRIMVATFRAKVPKRTQRPGRTTAPAHMDRRSGRSWEARSLLHALLGASSVGDVGDLLGKLQVHELGKARIDG